MVNDCLWKVCSKQIKEISQLILERKKTVFNDRPHTNRPINFGVYEYKAKLKTAHKWNTVLNFHENYGRSCSLVQFHCNIKGLGKVGSYNADSMQKHCVVATNELLNGHKIVITFPQRHWGLRFINDDEVKKGSSRMALI